MKDSPSFIYVNLQNPFPFTHVVGQNEIQVEMISTQFDFKFPLSPDPN